jgi:murein L,D-transpeptidase YcbB/YkuD
LLRKRLVISDDLAPELEAGDSYDAALVDAVKHFQLRHELEANGSIGPQTLRALNVPVAARIKQLEASLERLLGMDFVFAERYVVVNIPAAFVEAVAHDKVERRYRVIFTGPTFEADLSGKHRKSPVTSHQEVPREQRPPLDDATVRDCMMAKDYKIETEAR